MGFWSLQHSRERKSASQRPCPSRRLSAFRVWLPSWRLSPSAPLPVLFHTGGAHGIHPSELPPPARYPVHLCPEAPTYRLPCRCYRCRKQRAGPTGRGFWAFALAGVPGRQRGISAPTAGCSLGFCPSRVFGPKPQPGFRPTSSHALSLPEPGGTGRGATESRLASTWTAPFFAASRYFRIGQPF